MDSQNTSGNKFVHFTTGNNSGLYSSTPVASGIWNNIVVTFKDSTHNAKIYINGVFSSESFDFYPSYDSAILRIGSEAYDAYFKGKIDDVAIYSRLLSLSEIRNLYDINGLSYHWSTGDTASSINVSPSQTTTYYCTITNGVDTCRDSVTVTVNPLPQANFVFTPNTSCGRTKVSFTDSSSISSGNISSWIWDFGDGDSSTSQSPVHIFRPTPGDSGYQTFNVRLIVFSNNGCSDTITRTITIKRGPDATLLSSADATDYNGEPYFIVCTSNTNANLTFFNATTTSFSNTRYVINWGDGTPNIDSLNWQNGASVGITHNYAAGTYKLTYYVYAGGCLDSTVYNVFVGGNPAGGINISSPYSCSKNDQLFVISNTGNNTPGTLYIFSTTDASLSDTFVHPIPNLDSIYHRFEVSSCGYTFNGGFNTYQNAFGATLKMINPCGTTTSFVAPIYVSDKSVASFTNVSSDTICTTQSITLINNSVPGNSVINGVCTPGKSVWSVSSPTAGANYNVVSGSLGSAATANPAIWTLGSDSLVLNFTAPGVYYVKIKAANNSSCSGDSVVKTIYVNAIPVIGDTAISLCTGNSFTFMPSNNNGNTIPVGTRYTWTALADSNIIGYSNSFVSQSALTQTLINLSNLTQQVVYTVTPVSVAPSYCTGASFKLTVTVNPKLKIADTAISVCTGSIFNFIPTTGVSGNIVPPNQVFAWSNPAISTGLTGAGGGSGTSVTDTLFNTADTIKTATYTVIAANSCGIDTFKLVVKVNPSPKLTFTPSSQNICSGDSTLNVFITASIPGTNVYWSCNPPASISGATTFGQNVIFSQALVNLSDTVVKVPYIASPSTAGLISCSSPNATYYITVNPRPKINNDTVQACSGTAFNATPVNVLPYTIVPVGTTYTWTVVGTNANVTGQSNRTSGSSTISQTLTNLTIVPQTVVYAVAARSGAAGNCVSAPFFITVVVNPKPVIPAQTATICSGSTFFVMLVNNQPTTATIVPSGTTYTWTVAANTNVAGQGNQSVGIGYISQTLVNNSNTVQRLLYTVTPLSGGCSGTPFVLTVTVNPKPAIPSQFISICSGSAFSVIPANALPRTIVPSGTTYTWTISSNTNLAGQNSQSVSQIGVRDTLTNLTNASQTIVYIVTPTTGTCVGTSFNIYVTVNPKPVIPAQTSTICSGSSFYITPVNAQPAIIVPANTTYTWTVASNANVTGENSVSTSSSYIADTLTNTSNVVQAVIYTVTPFSGACFGSPFTVTVYVYPRPLISTQYTTACSGSAFVFTAVNAAPTTIVPVGTTYTWVVVSNANVTGYSTQSTASSTISQTLTNLTNVTQVVTYYVTPTSGSCVGSAFVLNVYVYPKATIPTQTAAICSGAAFYVNPANGQPTSSTIVPSGTTYKWTVVSNANVSGESAQTVAQTSISQTLTNLTNTTQVVVYTVTPTSGSCVGASFTVYVYVYAKPVIGSQSTTVCSGTAFDYIPTNAPPTTIVPSGTTYTWIVASNTTTNVTGQTDQSVSQSAINQTLTNTTGVSQLVNYLVTPINGNCTGAPFVLIVTVNPKPLIPYQGIVGICSGSSFVVSPVDAPPTTIAPAGTKYTWTVSTNTNVTGQSAQTVAQSYISQTLTNISNTTQYVLYTVTPTLGSCIGSTFTFYVRVAPKPVIQNQTTTICSGSTFAVSPTNAAPTIIVPSGTTYTWTVSSNTNVVGQSNQSIAQAYVSQTLTNLTNVVQSVVYTVTPTSGTTGNCVGSAFYVTVVVNPKAVIPSQNPISICSGSSFSFTPVNNPPSLIVPTGTKYVWTISANSNLTGQNSQSVSKLSISDTITNLTNTDQVLLYTVTPISGNCVGASFSFEVIVNPKPVIPTQTAIICSGSNFYVLPVNGQPTSSTIVPLNTTYTWTVSSNTNVSGQSSQSIPQSGISQNLINNSNTAQTVIYTVTPLSGTYGNCQGAPFYIYVTVNPLPIISSQSTTICSGSTFVVSPVNAAPTTIVPSGTTYTWTVSSNTSVSGQGAQTVGQSYISQTLTNLSNAVQNVVYYVTPRYGSCIGSTFIVNVIVNPKASIPSQTLDICSGSTFYVNPINGQPTSSTVVPSGTTYKWTVVANANVTGESSQTIAQQYISQTLTNITNVAQTVVYTVTPTTGNCLGASFIVTVYVNPKPLVASQTTTICSGSVFLISPINASPTTIVPVGTTYTWVVASNVNVTGQSNQTVPASSISQTLTNLTNVTQSIVYTITPSSGGCVGNSFTVTVNVSPKPIIPSQGIISICSGSTFGVSPVNSQPTVIVPAGTKYTWTISTNTNITGQSAQTVAQSSISQTLTNVSNTVQYLIYTVTPISGVCTGNTFSIIVRVYPKPLIAAQAVSICSGSTFVVSPVNAQPTAIVPATTLYTWTVAVNNNVSGQTDQAVGQSIISQNLVNLTNTVQTISYTVTPVSGPNEGNCVGTSFRLTVTVNPVPKISDASLTICNGTAFNLSPVNNVPNTIVPAGTVYTWTVASNTNVIGQSNQTIGASSIGQILNNLTNTAQNVVYTVTPRSGNCYGSIFTVTITVNAKPVIPSQTISSCSGSTVVFAANNLPPSIIVPSGTIYTWTVPSNPNVTGESNQTAASTIFSQTLTNTTNAPQSLVYTVTPRTSSCIGSSFAITVTVNPKPKVANTTTAICSGSRFTFTPSSTVTGNLIPIGIRYLWSTPATPLSLTGGASGSGSSITGLLSNSSAVVQNAVYTVTPFYVGISGDTCVGNTFLLIVTVNPLPPVVVNPNPAIICYGNSITLSATGADRYTWSPAVGLSDTTSAVVSANPTSTTIYIVNGVNQTTGCSKVAEVVVTVNPTPAVTVTPLNTILCKGYSTTLIASGADSYSWSPSAGLNSSVGSSVVASPDSTTAYLVTGAVQSTGCTDTAIAYISVNPIPAMPTVTNNSPLCSGDTLRLSAQTTTTGNVIYSWQYPDLTFHAGANVTIPNVGVTSSGIYSVAVTINSCTSPVATTNVVVRQSTSSVTNATICLGQSYLFNTVSYTQSGSYTYRTTNAIGCDSLATLNLIVRTASNTIIIDTACNSYTWHGDTYTSSATYTYNATNIGGCDSIETLQLVIVPFNTNPIAQDTIIACGSSYVINAQSGYNSYLWSTGATVSRTLVTSTGWYTCMVGNGYCSYTDSVFVSIVNANIVNNDTSICLGQSIALSASNITTSGLLRDADGNTYPTVNIGNQVWSQKNLNVSRYKNGDIIPQVTDPTQWSNLTTGAWCWYNNDSASYAATYGKLYNWYAVNDPRGLALEGWHVPNDWDWNRLVKHLDANADTICQSCIQSNSAGGAMKSTIGWNALNVGATNISGFNGLPGGGRYPIGTFLNSGTIGVWWSIFEYDSIQARERGLYNDRSIIGRSYSEKKSGFSLRLISNNTNSFIWSTGDTTATINVSPTQTTTYYCTVSNGISSCTDSVVVRVKQPSSSSQSVTSCNYYTWHGNTYTQSGVYTYSTLNAVGCDSVVTLNLTIAHPTSSTQTIAACNSYNLNGVVYYTNGVYVDTLVNASGCDSIVTINLTINHADSTIIAASACNNYTWHGVTYTTSGAYTYTGANTAGCDSVITLYLTIRQGGGTTETITSCNNYTWNDTTYTQSGVYTFVNPNFQNVAIINNQGSSGSVVVGSSSYYVNESIYTDAEIGAGNFITSATAIKKIGFYVDQLGSPATVNNFKVWMKNISSTTSTFASGTYTTTGYTLVYNGAISPTSAGLYTINLTTAFVRTAGSNLQLLIERLENASHVGYIFATANGNQNSSTALSTRRYNGTVVPSSTTSLVASAFRPAIRLSGIVATDSTTCENLSTLNLTIGRPTTSTQIVNACNSYSWNGTTYSSSGSYTKLFTNASGCDSTAVLSLAINTIQTNLFATDSINVCASSYTLDAGAGYTSYLWSTGASSQLINISSTNWYKCTVANANCTASDSVFVLINSTTLPAPANLTGFVDICSIVGTTNATTYTTDAVPGAIAYQWTLPPGAVIDSGSNGLQIKVHFLVAGAKDTIAVQAIGLGGCLGIKNSLRLITTNCVTTPFAKVIKTNNVSDFLDVSVYPNPSTTYFNLKIKSSSSESIMLRVFDLQGRLVKNFKSDASKISLFGQELMAGMYLIEVSQGGRKKTVKVEKY